MPLSKNIGQRGEGPHLKKKKKQKLTHTKILKCNEFSFSFSSIFQKKH